MSDVFGQPEPRQPERDPLVDPEAGMRIPDDAVDALLDGELTRADSAKLFRQLMGRPDEAKRIAETERALEAMRRPVACPDFTKRVLNEIDRQRSWLPSGGVKRVMVWRAAAAVAFLALVAGGFVARRIAPEATTLVDRPAPVSDLARAVSYESASVLTPVQNAVAAIRNEFSPVKPEVSQPMVGPVIVVRHERSRAGCTADDMLTWLDSIESCRGNENTCGRKARLVAGECRALPRPNASLKMQASFVKTDFARPGGTEEGILLFPGR